MEDLIIPIFIFFFFLFVLILTLKKENFAENKFLIISCLLSIIGILIFTILQISVSNLNVTAQNESDLNKKILSIWIITFAYFFAIISNLLNKRKSWLNHISLLFQILILLLAITLRLIATSFI